MNTQNRTYIGLIAILVAMVVVGILAFVQTTKALKQTAIQGCMTVGVDEFNYPDTNTKSTTLNKEAYTFCMEEKGYQVK